MKLLGSKIVKRQSGQRVLIARVELQSGSESPTQIDILDPMGKLKKMHALKTEIVRLAVTLNNGHQVNTANQLGLSRNTIRSLLPPEDRVGRGGHRRKRPPPS